MAYSSRRNGPIPDPKVCRMMTSWHTIWSERSLPSVGTDLERLLAASGYDTPFSSIDAETWRHYVQHVLDALGSSVGSSVLDVGCGAGAMLFVLHQLGYEVAGVDYSGRLIAIARSFLPDAELVIGDADSFECSREFDYVIANSVFHYFPSLEYALRTLERMTRTASAGVAILDVPDAATESDSLREREQILGTGAYARRYKGLNHLAYEREWFVSELGKVGWRVVVEDQCIPSYANSEYRFNIYGSAP